jgi:hypothetical protein
MRPLLFSSMDLPLISLEPHGGFDKDARCPPPPFLFLLVDERAKQVDKKFQKKWRAKGSPSYSF